MNEVAAVGTDISGVFCKVYLAQKKKKSDVSFAQHFFSASPITGFELCGDGESLLAFFPASHLCRVLICRVAAPSVERLGIIIDRSLKMHDTLGF